MQERRFPVIDAHQHFWDPARFDYPWMQAPGLAPIRRPFGPADLSPLMKANGVDASIAVQCCSSVDETRALLAMADETPFVAGVVGWIDLDDADAGASLDGLAHRKLVGIRHEVHDEDDPRWLVRDEVKRGLAAVLEHDLAYDLLVRSRELPAAIEVARAFPHGRFILDHAAKPPIASGFDREWAARLAELAACSNVWCKISGLVTEAVWDDWSEDQLLPVIRHAWNVFGADRLIFGSDWPVCLLAGEYRAVKTATEACLKTLPGVALDQVLGLNATEAYKLAIGEHGC